MTKQYKLCQIHIEVPSDVKVRVTLLVFGRYRFGNRHVRLLWWLNVSPGQHSMSANFCTINSDFYRLISNKFYRPNIGTTDDRLILLLLLLSSSSLLLIIPQSVLRQVHSLFQSHSPHSAIPYSASSIYSILSFPHGYPIAAYVFLLVFLLPLDGFS